MQIELIAPASDDSAVLPKLGLGILAALTPAQHEVVYTDEVVRPFDLERDLKPVDLVGVSADSKTAHRAYTIADAYRQRGVPVVLGGLHPTALPEEAARHADAVVVGEAEDLWPAVLEDFSSGSLKPVYRGALPSLAGRPWPRRDLFRSRKYVPFNAVQTMRGCPYPCEFCSVSLHNGTSLRFRPVDDVLGELRQLGRLILFADDNVMIQKAYSRELFTRMIPLNKHWVGQCSLAGISQVRNVELMAKSGCRALFVGFESIDRSTLKQTGKAQNDPAAYRDIVEQLHDHGIAIWGSFVFGFDSDDPEVFDRTVQFGIDARLTMALYALLTPYPGTRLYQRLLSEGRLIDEHWWLHPDRLGGPPYFVPTGMSREQLRDGWLRAWKRFYSAGSIWRRWTIRPGSSWVQTAAYLPLNLFQQRRVAARLLGREASIGAVPQPPFLRETEGSGAGTRRGVGA